jgi:hypothetical protein
MTKSRRVEYKKANQARREELLKRYYKVKPGEKGWISNPGFIQKGKYATGN